MKRDDENRIRHMSFLYAREEHGVTASIECGRYHCTITLHKRDGSDVVASVNPRASIVEVQTAIDAAIKKEPPSLLRPDPYAFAAQQQAAYNPYTPYTGNALANAPLSQSTNAFGMYGGGLGSLLGLYPFK